MGEQSAVQENFLYKCMVWRATGDTPGNRIICPQIGEKLFNGNIQARIL
jgi:hypothetical protein